jgi:lipoyl(octanoyl) transferase
MALPSSPTVAWCRARDPVPYEAASAAMAERVNAIAAGRSSELVWLLEHPPLYTAGTSAKPEDLLAPSRLPVHRTGRGGQYTYHGPGQRVAYVMLDVRRRFGDVRGERRQGQVGVWVKRPGRDGESFAKIAAIGVRLSRWISSHGISLNVAPNLSDYAGIVPCGVRDAGVTSLAELGRADDMDKVDAILRAVFERQFAPTRDVEPDRIAVVPG